MRSLPILSLLAWLGCATAQGLQLTIQTSPLAGSQYYAVGSFWQQLQVGDRLELQREPDNRHDPLAVRVNWRGHQLGYLPRVQNRVVARALDDGVRLGARIAALREHPDPWLRVVVEVYGER